MQIGKNTFKIKEFLSARDLREINQAMMSKIELGTDGKPKSLNYNSVIEQENALIARCIEAINDNAENILDTVLDLPAPEYNELMKHLRELMGLEQSEQK